MWRWELTDPALIRIWPRKWLNDPEIAPSLLYLDRYLHDFQQTTSTTITSTVNRDAYDSTIGVVFGEYAEDQRQEESYSEVVTVETRLITKVINNETFIPVSNMLLKCKNKSTVKLPEVPTEDFYVYVHNGDGTLVTINGNGKKVNGHDSISIMRKGNGLQVYYFIEDDEYILI